MPDVPLMELDGTSGGDYKMTDGVGPYGDVCLTSIAAAENLYFFLLTMGERFINGSGKLIIYKCDFG